MKIYHYCTGILAVLFLAMGLTVAISKPFHPQTNERLIIAAMVAGCICSYLFVFTGKMVITLSSKGIGHSKKIVHDIIVSESEVYILPEYYASALINGDFSGLNDEEINALQQWLKEVEPGDCVGCSDEPYFHWTNDMNTGKGGNVLEYTFLKYPL